jgi:hypothetical protein
VVRGSRTYAVDRASSPSVRVDREDNAGRACLCDNINDNDNVKLISPLVSHNMEKILRGETVMLLTLKATPP